MPQTIRQADFDFLVEFDAWVKCGRVAKDFGRPPSTITMTCDRYGLKARRGVGLVDKRTDQTLTDLIDAGLLELPVDQDEASDAETSTGAAA